MDKLELMAQYFSQEKDKFRVEDIGISEKGTHILIYTVGRISFRATLDGENISLITAICGDKEWSLGKEDPLAGYLNHQVELYFSVTLAKYRNTQKVLKYFS